MLQQVAAIETVRRLGRVLAHYWELQLIAKQTERTWPCGLHSHGGPLGSESRPGTTATRREKA